MIRIIRGLTCSYGIPSSKKVACEVGPLRLYTAPKHRLGAAQGKNKSPKPPLLRERTLWCSSKPRPFHCCSAKGFLKPSHLQNSLAIASKMPGLCLLTHRQLSLPEKAELCLLTHGLVAVRFYQQLISGRPLQGGIF